MSAGRTRSGPQHFTPLIRHSSNASAKLCVHGSAWIALRSRGDQHHAEADRLFREAADPVSFAVMAAAKCKRVLGFDGDFAAAGFELWRGC